MDGAAQRGDAGHRRRGGGGDSTWFEGLQLLAVYAVLGLTFYFV